MDTLAAAAERGMLAAGFVNVRAEVEPGARGIEVRALGDCPCGLGRSGFAMRVSPEMVKSSIVSIEDVVENRIHQMGLKHIEVDKAEGRWA